MGGAVGPEGVHGPREHTGPPCLREDLPDGHPIQPRTVTGGVLYPSARSLGRPEASAGHDNVTVRVSPGSSHR